MLTSAVRLAEHRPDGFDRTELRIEHAEAQLACGRLIKARAAFESATAAAERRPRRWTVDAPHS